MPIVAYIREVLDSGCPLRRRLLRTSPFASPSPVAPVVGRVPVAKLRRSLL